MSNLLNKVPKRMLDLVATMVRSIFAQPMDKKVRAHHKRVVDQLQNHFLKAAKMLSEAGKEILASQSLQSRLNDGSARTSPGAVEPRGKAKERCSEDLSQLGSGRLIDWICACRIQRRMGG